MVNELVAPNTDGYSGIANSEGTVSIPEEYFGGMSFIRFKLDKDRNVLINNVTGEESPELLVRICGVKLERVLIDEGQLVCASRDSKYSKDGVLCETCPNITNSFIDEGEQKSRYDEACKRNNIENPPAWNSKSRCSFRLVIQWTEQFERNDDGSYMWIYQPGLCYLSCPPTSLYAMTSRKNGYLSALKSKGYGDLKHIVTVIAVGQRRNETLKTNYSYETFEMEDTYDAVTKKCVNYNEMVKALGGAPQIASTPAPAPQIVQQAGVEPVQSELPQPAPKVPPQLVKKVITVTRAVEQAKPVEAIQPAQLVASPTELRLKIKYAYATLPVDVQQIILNVLKIDAIEKVTDNDLRVAFETLECAKSEVAERSKSPDTKPAETPTPVLPATSPIVAKKKTNPW